MMLALAADVPIWLCTQPTDMRRSFDGLAAIVSQQMQQIPHGGALFVFINRKCTQMKCLYFEPGGYCIWAKRLEQGQFASLGRPGDMKKSLTRTEFISLIEGVDVVIKKHRKRYKKTSN